MNRKRSKYVLPPTPKELNMNKFVVHFYKCLFMFNFFGVKLLYSFGFLFMFNPFRIVKN
jgi:hypothetical protein